MYPTPTLSVNPILQVNRHVNLPPSLHRSYCLYFKQQTQLLQAMLTNPTLLPKQQQKLHTCILPMLNIEPPTSNLICFQPSRWSCSMELASETCCAMRTCREINYNSFLNKLLQLFSRYFTEVVNLQLMILEKNVCVCSDFWFSEFLTP